MSSVGFVRPDAAARAAVALDPSQRAVLALAEGEPAAVIGAPGTGKTTVLVELLADRVLRGGYGTDEVLALTTSRAAATRLRDLLALRIGRPTDGPLARTFSSLAFELARSAARVAGSAPPRLLTGAEQDADIADILAGQEADGTGPDWPDPLDASVRRLRGFRSELRELMARATEYDFPPARLRELGRATGRPEWVAAADFIEGYLRIVSSARPAQYDAAELTRYAVTAIDADRSSADGTARVSRLRLVVVDDLQEATEGALAMLRAIASRGVAVVAFGDPDVAANAFRGGEPDALGRLSAELGVPARQLVLSTAHRQGAALRALTVATTQRIGAAAAGPQRRASAGASEPAEPLLRIEAPSPARAWAAVARQLREEHLMRGVPWSELAVVVRSGAQAPALSRALALAEVPTRTSSGGVALRDEKAARALLTLVEVGIGAVDLTPELAVEVLSGPFGGLDIIALRRLRLSLRAEELAAGGIRPSGELLVEALQAPGGFATIDSAPARAAARLAETLAQLRTADATIEELLWLAWERSRLAQPWRQLALGSGIPAAEANRDLDAVVALFAAAKDYVERRTQEGVDARGIATSFIEETLRPDVPEDVLAPRRIDDAVLVTTPSGVVGLEFRTVVVAGLQDGAWPNLRPRGSLLGPQHLVRLATGGSAVQTLDERKLVLDDELRMLALAVSRARERVVFAAVVNDDEARSVFFSLLPESTPLVEAAGAVPLTLRGVTGRLRRTLTETRAPRAEVEAAAASLAELGRLGLPGADPADWHGLEPISSTGPLYDGEPIRVSPSRIERLEESPLDWFLEQMAGGDSGVVANVGTIIHWAMETTPEPSFEALWQAVEARWAELVFESPWFAERQQRLARGFTQALADYLGDFAQDGKSLVAAEGRFLLQYSADDLDDLPPAEGETAPRPRVEVHGSIDRVEVGPDGSVVIVDLKTGRPITSQSAIDALPQLGAYQLAYAEGHFGEHLADVASHRAGGAKLLYVREGKGDRRYREGVQAVLDDEGLEGVRERIRRAAVLIAAAAYEGRLELEQYGGLPTIPRLRLHRVPAVSSDEGAS
ncbi:ATP-dependent DNA helicase AdnA [Pseudolysinimonas kribbensis]|uniref:DNA 3'-5' helicase n=1 Tax=Pseudolysinimonas kribbensis TaxID=433641 RepID=A0ABQ6KBQ2_9MICO|nr:ATP-dependent DNA helicase [Pseudolysinimonas kribbensis]GMA96319.1 DNA helicase [Pseudolysinimonas kribbensis]